MLCRGSFQNKSMAKQDFGLSNNTNLGRIKVKKKKAIGTFSSSFADIWRQPSLMNYCLHWIKNDAFQFKNWSVSVFQNDLISTFLSSDRFISRTKNNSKPSNCLLCDHFAVLWYFSLSFCWLHLWLYLCQLAACQELSVNLVLAAVAWLRCVQGPRGFRPALFSPSGDTCVVTGQLHYGLPRGWLVVAVRVNRARLCVYITANAPRGGCSTLRDRQGHHCV